ncbi:hypothetical protein B0H13DRAFT_40187 [Mycena leptocephala]|nr:hypothetical protein B0H13DRAFT_40187 [Mycena leptocephala]
MDPLLAGITVGTFVKDLVQLVQNIKNSIDKVSENKERLSKLRDEVVGTLNGLTKLTEANEYKEPSPELLSALENLKSYLRHIQDKCQRQASRQRTSRVSGVDTFKSWWKRSEIQAEIKRLDECRNECYTQFTLFSAARTEGKTVQIANNTARVEKGTVQIAGTTARIDDGVVQIAKTTARIEERTGQTADRVARVEESTVQISDTTVRVEERTVQIADTTTRIEDITVRVHVSELEQKLEKWLQYPPDMKKKQDDTQELHHEGTGSWFLRGPQFSEWKDKPGCLWMRGNSGTGKTP